MNIHQDKRTGWKAETNYEMGPGVTLEIITRRSYRGALETHAQVWKIKNGMRSHGFGIGDASYGDFSRTITTTTERATEKNVRQQHAAAEAMAESLKAEALAFYARKTKQTQDA